MTGAPSTRSSSARGIGAIAPRGSWREAPNLNAQEAHRRPLAGLGAWPGQGDTGGRADGPQRPLGGTQTTAPAISVSLVLASRRGGKERGHVGDNGAGGIRRGRELPGGVEARRGAEG